jgi:EAL domain-containing protein (putative c-di-GMP-specific phosphodiesterase class I)
MQGYLVARPMPARDLADLIRRWPELPRPLASDELPVSVQGSLSGALGHR